MIRSEQHRCIGVGLRATGKPGFLWTQSVQPVNKFGQATLEAGGIPGVITGLEAGLRAVAGARRWSKMYHKRQTDHVAPAATPPSLSDPAARPEGERATLNYLARYGVPVIPATLATSAAAAANAAQAIGDAVAMKIASADIAHKTEVGGVKLNVAIAAVEGAFEEIMASAAAALPSARLDGVVVSPMRSSDLELFCGVARDPQWGLVLAMGLGGVWVEVLGDSALTLLPTTPAEVEKKLRSLKSAKLFEGFRGRPGLDVARAAEVIAHIGDAAIALGPDLMALEVNPLSSRGGNEIEALDALALWRAPSA